MATVKCKNANNFYITVTYETGAGYFKITKITGYYSHGKAGDCTKDYAHEVYNGNTKLGTVTSYKGSYASGNGYGWLASTSSPWVWKINNPTFNTTGSVTLKIKIKGSVKKDTVFTAESAFNVSPATGVLDVNPYINGVEHASGLSGFTFDLSGAASASNQQDYYNASAVPGSYTATPRAKTGYSTTASSGTLSAGESLTLTPRWQINQYYLDVNGRLDGVDSGSLGDYGVCSVDVGGTRQATNVADYYAQHNYGSAYSVHSITANSGYQYDGSVGAAVSGNIGTSTIDVRLAFSRRTYTHRISHWTWGYVNGEGNNDSKQAFALGDTTFTSKYKDSFTINTDRKVTIPNGFSLRNKFGTSYQTGSWTTYDMGKSYTTSAAAGTFEFDYDPISYSITYTMNGGTNSASNPSTYNVLYGVTFANPTRSGYDFKGWKIGNNTVTGINPGANASFSSVDDLRNKCAARTTGNQTVVATWLETKPSNVKFTSTSVDGPFQISLQWSATGLNISDYTVYYKPSTSSTWLSKSFGTSTTGSLAVNEETTYDIYVKATNPGGNASSSTITLTTPADQAKIRIKKDGVWRKGKTYYKKDGKWVKAKKLYMKIDGKWVINYNFDPGERK